MNALQIASKTLLENDPDSVRYRSTRRRWRSRLSALLGRQDDTRDDSKTARATRPHHRD